MTTADVLLHATPPKTPQAQKLKGESQQGGTKDQSFSQQYDSLDKAESNQSTEAPQPESNVSEFDQKETSSDAPEAVVPEAPFVAQEAPEIGPVPVQAEEVTTEVADTLETAMKSDELPKTEMAVGKTLAPDQEKNPQPEMARQPTDEGAAPKLTPLEGRLAATEKSEKSPAAAALLDVGARGPKPAETRDPDVKAVVVHADGPRAVPVVAELGLQQKALAERFQGEREAPRHGTDLPQPRAEEPRRGRIMPQNELAAIAPAIAQAKSQTPSHAQAFASQLLDSDANAHVARVTSEFAASTTAHIATPTTQSVAAPAVAAGQVAAQMAVAISQSNSGNAQILLSPEELGRVRMVMSVQDATITMTIHTERPEVNDLLRRNIDALAQEFRSMGYDSISFEFGGESGDQAMTEEDTQQPAEVVMVDDPDTPTLLQQGVAKSGLDLRI